MITTQTHLQDDHCLAKEAEGKGNLWGRFLKRKVEERKVSNIHQLCDVVMEEDSSDNLWSSGELHAQEGYKAVLESNGGHTKYWVWAQFRHFRLGVYSLLWPAGLDIIWLCWFILRGLQMYTVIQAVQSLLCIVAKCHLFSVVTWKDEWTFLNGLHQCEWN